MYMYVLFQVNQAIDYFEDPDTWEDLKKGAAEPQEQFYWLIAGESNTVNPYVTN